MRLWLEGGVHPATAARHWLVHATARIALAVIFAYQGIVPKPVARDPDELAMLRNIGVASGDAVGVAQVLGVAELGFAVCLLAFWRHRWPPALTVVLMVAAACGVALGSPEYLVRAFNPLTLNLVVASLAAIDLIVLESVPSAARCRRRPHVSS